MRYSKACQGLVGCTDHKHEIASLSAETLAIQTALASVLYHLGKESPARLAANLLSKDEARRIAANIAKLPELLKSGAK